MKKHLYYYTLPVFILLLVGCATMQEIQKEYDQKMTEVSNYFANPTDKLMIKVESLDRGIHRIECYSNIGSISDINSSNQSFNAYTPYIRIIDLSRNAKLRELKETYNKFSDIEKGIMNLALITEIPTFTFTCQSQGYGGLDGKIYFNGKEVSSSVTNLEYGVIMLSYTLSLDDMLEEK